MSRPATIHTELVAGRWQALTLAEQLGNVGIEVGRALRAKRQGNDARMWGALDRALELIDLTISDPANKGRRKELCRAREVVCDFLVGDNEYPSTAESIDAYFMQFALAARRGR
jgi:hypothetical protein